MFCTQIQKIPYFEPTLDYITLRNFGTVRPIFTNIVSNVAQDSKEKVAKARCAEKISARAKRRGLNGTEFEKYFHSVQLSASSIISWTFWILVKISCYNNQIV